MGNVVNWFAKAADRGGGKTLGFQIGSYAKKPPKIQTPTIDEAANAQNETDRLSRRRGVLANIFAGNSTPSVSRKELLGQ